MGFGLSTYVPVSVYILCIVVFFVTCFYKQEVGLYFIVALLPMQNLMDKMHAFPLGNHIVDFYVGTLLLISLLKPVTKEDEDFKFLIPTRPILLYVLLTFIFLWLGSLELDLDLPLDLDNERLQNWKNHMILPALFLITVRTIRDKGQILLFVNTILFSLFVSGLYFYKNFWAPTAGFRWGRRGVGTFTFLGPNEIGAFWAEYSFIILGILFLCRLKFWKWPLLGLLGLNLYCLIYTFSRGAYLAFLAGFLFISLAHRNVKALIALVVFFIFWTSVVPTSVVQRVEMTETAQGDLESSSEARVYKWEHALNLFMKNPVGYGFQTVRYLGFSQLSGDATSHGNPHNRYVEFLVEMGVAGIGIFLYLFYLAYKSGWSLYQSAEDDFLKALGLGFAATVVASMVANTFGDRWTYEAVSGFYWVFWALVVRGNMIVQAERNKALTQPAVVLRTVNDRYAI